MSKNESNKKFPFVSIKTSVILGLFYFTVTPRYGTITKMCSGFVTQR